MGTRPLLCRRHGFELEILLCRPYRFLDPDYGVFACGGMAFIEANLNLNVQISAPYLAVGFNALRTGTENRVCAGRTVLLGWHLSLDRFLRGIKSSALLPFEPSGPRWA